MNNEMSPSEIKLLAEKVQSGTATPEEELQLLQYLNMGVEEMRAFIKTVNFQEK